MTRILEILMWRVWNVQEQQIRGLQKLTVQTFYSGDRAARQNFVKLFCLFAKDCILFLFSYVLHSCHWRCIMSNASDPWQYIGYIFYIYIFWFFCVSFPKFIAAIWSSVVILFLMKLLQSQFLSKYLESSTLACSLLPPCLCWCIAARLGITVTRRSMA